MVRVVFVQVQVHGGLRRYHNLGVLCACMWWIYVPMAWTVTCLFGFNGWGVKS